jgi:hypothetical protein
MIDRSARDILIANLSDFMNGEITNDEFVNRLHRTKDPAIHEIHISFVWFLYDDLHKHKMTGRYAPNDKCQRIVERCILFLKTNLEYEWPPSKAILYFLLTILTLGIWFLIMKCFRKKKNPKGDDEVWPFFRKEDYENAQRQ